MRAVFLSGQLLLALILAWMGFSLASCNEAALRARRAEMNALAVATITPVSADRPDRANQGRLVYVTGRTGLEAPLLDPELGIAVDGLALRRDVQMYQWEERSATSRTAPEQVRPDQCTDESVRLKLLGGARVRERHTVYSYFKVWSPEKRALTCEGRLPIFTNPPWTLEGKTIQAQDTSSVRLGGFGLGIRLPSELNAPSQPFALGPEQGVHLLPPYRSRASVVGGSLHVGDPRAPAIGDLKISYQVAPFADLTVVAIQNGDTLVADRAVGGGDLLEVKVGRHSLEELQREWRSPVKSTWGMNVLVAPFFLGAAFLVFWPLRALVRGLLGPNVEEAAVLVFTPLMAIALATGSVAWIRWRVGAGGALEPALVALGAVVALLPLAAWRSRGPLLGTGELLRRAYAAFNARDVEGVLAMLHPARRVGERDGGRVRPWPPEACATTGAASGRSSTPRGSAQMGGDPAAAWWSTSTRSCAIGPGPCSWTAPSTTPTGPRTASSRAWTSWKT